MNDKESDCLTTKELGAELGLKVSTLERWRRTGEGPEFVILPIEIRYQREAIESWKERTGFIHPSDIDWASGS